MKKIFIAASVAALALTSCRENDSMVESSNFGMNAVSAADCFTLATAEKTSTGTAAVTIPGVTATSTASPAVTWGMTQPFFNETFPSAWNVTPRNTGDFQGSWTKYKF